MDKKSISGTGAVKIRRALISVSDKNGLEPFAKALADHGVDIVSTGGTADLLKKAGIPVRDISDFTGFPEIMDGRVKTLHPGVHGGILARRDNTAHRQAMEENGISAIDMVVINLYPFAQTVEAGRSFEECIENIDIGGPAMIRSAAKNHEYVAVVTDPEHYETILKDMKLHEGAVSHVLRRQLAAEAFALTAWYDSNIANWLGAQQEKNTYPQHISFSGKLAQELRYGENPHQRAALYLSEENRPGAARATQIQGKELSYNNLNDTNAAFELVAEFEAPAVAIIKHANPCGAAVSENLFEAYEKALACDPVSAFGGIIALNRTLDRKTAQAIAARFVEVIIAPDIEEDALEILKKKDKIRVLKTSTLPKPESRRIMSCIGGGFLVQDNDNKSVSEKDLKIVTDRAPTKEEIRDMIFAFRVAKHVKSNAIVYARNRATVGIGAGQMSRVDSARIAAWKAGEAAKEAGLPESLAKDSVVASDAFFPFADGLISAAEAGVTAVIQPGGSIRDDEVIRAANERGLAMVFTGFRHFRH